MRAPSLAAPLTLIALSLSGGASLVYQVAWTRRLISVTSATATAQAFVLAVFMAGLGLGAHAAGRWGARLRRPLLGYACVEAIAAVLAIAWFPFLDGCARARDALAGRGASPDAGLAVQLGLASLYLLVPTTLLGASLPLALEHHARVEPERSRGRIIAAFYGVNTLGATLGCLAAGFVAVERFGLLRSTALGALAALGAAAIAAGVAPRAPLPAAPLPSPAGSAGSDRGLLLAAGLAGFAGLGAEVVWTRLFGLILFNTVYVLTEVLAAVLVGIALGSVLAGAVSRRDDPARRFRDAGLCAALAAVLMGVIPLVVVAHAGSMDFLARVAGGHALVASLTLLSCLVPASALLAAVLPLLAAAARDTPARSFGSVYAANIAGSVIGSLLTGFVLIPRLGLARAGAALELGTLALALILLLRGAGLRLALPACAVAAAGCALLFTRHRIPEDIYTSRLPGLVTVRELHEGVSSHVMVAEDESRGERRLWINAAWVAGTGGPHRAFGHLPGLFVASPRRVLR